MAGNSPVALFEQGLEFGERLAIFRGQPSA